VREREREKEERERKRERERERDSEREFVCVDELKVALEKHHRAQLSL
jgi:hypothetical protein